MINIFTFTGNVYLLKANLEKYIFYIHYSKLLEARILANICNCMFVQSYTNSVWLIQIFLLMNKNRVWQHLHYCSFIQAYSVRPTCRLQSTFPPIPNNIRPDSDQIICHTELINKHNQNTANKIKLFTVNILKPRRFKLLIVNIRNNCCSHVSNKNMSSCILTKQAKFVFARPRTITRKEQTIILIDKPKQTHGCHSLHPTPAGSPMNLNSVCIRTAPFRWWTGLLHWQVSLPRVART